MGISVPSLDWRREIREEAGMGLCSGPEEGAY